MRRVVPVLFALLSLASPTAAQSHPDFSGKWVLDPKSAEGPMAPLAMTLTVTQDGKTIKTESVATTQMGEQKSGSVFNLDGSQSKNTITTPNGAIDMVSTGKWDGSVFSVTTSADIQGQPLQQNDRWSLDADGKTLRLERNISVAGQSFSLKLAFNKQ